jgi:hypothetical protein
MIAKSDVQQKDKNGYWNNELQSLGIEPKNINELNDMKELENLADNVKLSMFQDYKTAYSNRGDRYRDEAQATVST